MNERNPDEFPTWEIVTLAAACLLAFAALTFKVFEGGRLPTQPPRDPALLDPSLPPSLSVDPPAELIEPVLRVDGDDAGWRPRWSKSFDIGEPLPSIDVQPGERMIFAVDGREVTITVLEPTGRPPQSTDADDWEELPQPVLPPDLDLTKEQKFMRDQTLKIHDPGDDAPKDRELSPLQFFEAYLAPEMEAKKQSTKLRQYKNSLSRFTGFLANAANSVTIRGIGDVTDLHAIQWQQFELETNGLKASTINVHWSRIGAVFRRAAPAAKGNPKGLGVIDRAPYLAALPTPRPRPMVVTLDVLDALYRFGAKDMSWPPKSRDGIAPSLRWRVWLVCTYNLAMRTRDLLGLRWENIHTDPRSLDPESDNESPHGWVEWVPSKTKAKKPDPLILPLNVHVRTHLESIRTDSPFVFGRELAKVNNDALYGRESRPNSGYWPTLVMNAAARSDDHGQRIRPFKIKAIRATSNTQFKKLHPKLGEHVLGHAPRGVNDMFYTQWEADVIGWVSELPQPKSFKREPRASIVRQESLF